MRIAVFFTHILHYHAARIAGLLSEAERGGHQVEAFALRSGAREFPVGGYEGLLNGRIDVLSPEACEPGVYSSHIAKAQVLRKLDACDPDAVAIIGYDGLVPRAALGWCRYRRRGAVLMSESQATDYARSPVREFVKGRLVSLFDAALVGGTRHAEYARQLGLPADRVFIGYDVVDNAFWGRRADEVRAEADGWRARLTLPERFFLTACRFVTKKNVPGLIRSYSMYVSSAGASAWPLVLIGGGPDEAAIRRQIDDAGLQPNVVLPGYLSAEQVAPYYALASVFVMPSSHSEQWGLVVNEAMASGTPVFVSRVCGCCADLVEDGVTGYAFDPADDAELSGLMGRAAEMDMATLGAEARRRVGCYSPELFGSNLLRASQAAAQHAATRRRCPWPRPERWR